MAKQVAKLKTGIPTKADIESFKRKTDSQGSASDTNTYGNFVDGYWSYGKEENPMPEGQWVINTMAMEMGFILWIDKVKKDEVMTNMMFGEAISRADLPRHEGVDLKDWDEQRKLQMVHKETGFEVIINKSTGGMADCFKALSDSILAQMQKSPKQAFPVVELDYSTYPNKSYGGITYKPVLHVVGWHSAAQLDKLAALDDGTGIAKVAKAAPKKAVKRKPSKNERVRVTL